MHRFAQPSVICYFHLLCCLYATSTEISSRIIFFLMSAVMPILPTSTSPFIILTGAYLLAWLDPWPIWLLKFSTNAATLTPLIGGHSVFVPLNFFLGADHSGAARIPHSPIAFPKMLCASQRTQERSVVLWGLTSLVECVFSSYLYHVSFEFFLSQLLERDPHKRYACSPQGDSLDEIQRHPWFSSIDWAALNRKELPSPFVPDVGLFRSRPLSYCFAHDVLPYSVEEGKFRCVA